MGAADCGKEPGEDFHKFKNDIDTCLAEISSSMQDNNYGSSVGQLPPKNKKFRFTRTAQLTMDISDFPAML